MSEKRNIARKGKREQERKINRWKERDKKTEKQK
jgi:hypothetical protein